MNGEQQDPALGGRKVPDPARLVQPFRAIQPPANRSVRLQRLPSAAVIDRDVHGQGHGSAASRGARGPTSTGVALAATLLLPATTQSLTTAPPIVAPALAWGAPLAASFAAWPVAGRAADRRGGQRPPRPQQERVEQTRPLAEAQAALRARQPARALAITDQALKVVPNDSELRFTRGLALVALERGDEAEADFAA